MEKYAAVILAAGKGTRMAPLRPEGFSGQGDSGGPNIPKVMFPLSGKPIIYHSVKMIREVGLKKIVLVVGYLKEMIQNYFDESVNYAVQEKQLGTGHATMMARDTLKGEAKAVIVFGGDNPLIKPETVKALTDLFENEKPTIAMLTIISDSLTDWAFGRVVRDEKGNVAQIFEQKDCDEKQLRIKEGNIAFYIFDAEWLWENIGKIDSDNAQKEIYLTDMVEIAKKQGRRVMAMPVSEESEALGINTQEQLKQAEEVLRRRQ